MRAIDAHVLKREAMKKGTRTPVMRRPGEPGSERVSVACPLPLVTRYMSATPLGPLTALSTVFPAADVYVGDPPRHNSVSADDQNRLSTQASIKSLARRAGKKGELNRSRIMSC